MSFSNMFKVRKIPLNYNFLQWTHIRKLNLQEYQSKSLMSKFGISVQRFQVASNEREAIEISNNFKAKEYVIKAQILAGGRGKGIFENGFKGGVHLTKNTRHVPELATKMLGQRLVTNQTSKSGVLVNKVMIAEALDISREAYLAILMDRSSGGVVVVSSHRGGMDIEDVAHNEPSAILKTIVDINLGITTKQANEIASHMKFETDKEVQQLTKQLRGLFDLFIQHDCTQIEINPLGLTPDKQIVCFDAKLNFDDNASFRQREIFDLFETEDQDPREVEAAKNGLNYIGLDGNIGCVVNGAGLAMATMDIVNLNGGLPANFLDLGGGVTVDQVTRAFHILTSDPRVKAIFVNIFGGIVNCAIVAEGLTKACIDVQLKLPLIVRLEGTNVDRARQILQSSGIPMHMSTDLDEAAKIAVHSAK